MLKINYFYKKIVRRLRYGFLWHIQCLISKNPMYSFLLADGYRFDYPLKSAVGRSLFSKGFELQEIEFARQILKSGDIFFDVGANGGLYTIVAAKRVGENGHVYAFEPGERELKLLRHNIAINNLTNVTIVECAVSNVKGKEKFAISVDGAMNSLLETNHPGQKIQEWQTVAVTTIDDIVQEFSINKIDVIKIDVEGAEKQVIAGAKNILASAKEITILFEASDLNAINFGYSVKDFLLEIISFGFFVYYLDVSGNLINVTDSRLEIPQEIYNFIASRVDIQKR